jgi:hypothetical protein
MIPAVGSVVTVTTRYTKRSFWHTNDYEDWSLTGTILPSPKWLTAEQIAVSNPSHPNGFSIINLARVIDLKTSNGASVSIKLPSDDYKEWTFLGSKGNNYLVIRTKGRYNCTCPGYTFRKHCRHIEEASHG